VIKGGKTPITVPATWSRPAPVLDHSVRYDVSDGQEGASSRSSWETLILKVVLGGGGSKVRQPRDRRSAEGRREMANRESRR